jgi:hypothetical protein
MRLVREAVRTELAEVVHDAGSATDRVEVLEDRLRHDLGLAIDAEAARSSARLVLDEMPAARPQPTPHEVLRLAVGQAPPAGMLLEFGVATGGTLRIISELRAGRPVFGFDSFTGLPQHWRPGFEQGKFAQPPPQVDGADLVVGFFADTLPTFLAEHPSTVAFLHCDADLYESTRTILEQVGLRLRRGSVVLFDEYFNYPWWQEHEHRAWTTWTTKAGVEFEYIAFTWNGQQVAVRVLATPWDDDEEARGGR